MWKAEFGTVLSSGVALSPLVTAVATGLAIITNTNVIMVIILSLKPILKPLLISSHDLSLNLPVIDFVDVCDD